MRINIFILGISALVLWSLVWYNAFRRNPLKWASPTCLFASGLIIFYIFPSLYWQFRPWNYYIPQYFEGLPFVLGSALIFGLPFLWEIFVGVRKEKIEEYIPSFSDIKFNNLIWMSVIPIILGVSWRIYLLSLGWQGKLTREFPKLFGSEALTLLVNNLPYYYAVGYFIMVAFGNKTQRLIGKIFWVMDGFFQLFIMHRFFALLFLLRSSVFATLLGWKLRGRHWVILGICALFILVIVGHGYGLMPDKLSDERAFLDIFEIAKVLKETTLYYAKGSSREYSIRVFDLIMASIDDAMYRLYEARSASAVMMNVPDIIPYFNGETFKNILYAVIPRYFWPEKPDLADIQSVTKWVMPSDSGVNPTGTLAEFYMNRGFFAVFIGGIICFLACMVSDWIMGKKIRVNPALLCAYPILAECFLLANHSFSQRASESIHWLLVFMLMVIFLKFAKAQ